MPIEDLRLCRGMVFKQSRQKKINDFIREHKKELEDLLRKIRVEGEICSLQIRDTRKITNFWGNPRFGK
ncbi:MAG: hypothetical protein AAB271_00920, partial [Nitrospirota bacterium]